MDAPKNSAWVMDLDDEGYPLLDGGIRGDEDEFLKLVFQNLRRYKSNDRYPLVTTVEGKDIFVRSFDDPLMAQEVVSTAADIYTWKFLGGLQLDVPESEICVDEWNRFHAYVGLERIPAVMSRQAQAAFLNSLKDPKKLHPQAFRRAFNEVNWNQRFVEGDTPWEMGGVSPVFLHNSKKMIEMSESDFLIPGTGRGHEVSFFEEQGKNVTVVDLSQKALVDFQSMYPKSRARCVHGDFFNTKLGPFDAILENYFFVALAPELRHKCWAHVAELLKPQGLYGGIFFLRQSESGPAYGLSQWELRAHAQEKFNIVEWELTTHSHPARQFMELWAVFQKK